MATRPQDKFNVHPEDAATFRERILPYWQGKTLEDTLRAEDGAAARRHHPRGQDQPEGPRPGAHLPRHGEVDPRWARPASAPRRPRGPRPRRADQREFYDARPRWCSTRRWTSCAGTRTSRPTWPATAETAGARRQPARGRPDLQQAEPRRRRDLPRGGPVALVPVHPAPHGEQRLVVLAGPRGPVPLSLLPRRPRRRPAGPGRCARARRGALAQVQPDRLPAELAQRVLLRRLPDRLQRRLRRPGRGGTRRVERALATSSSRPRRTSSCRSPTCRPASTRTRRTRSSTSAPG